MHRALLAVVLATATGSAQSVVINEVLADNRSVLADASGAFADCIELFNPTASPVAIGGASLSDDPNDSAKWPIPAGTVLAPGAFWLVWAGSEIDAGDRIALYAADGQTPLDAVDVGAPGADASRARLGDGAPLWVTLLEPTPGASNTVACATRRYTSLEPSLLPGRLRACGPPAIGATVGFLARDLPPSRPAALLVGFAPAHLPLGFDPTVLLLAPPLIALPTPGTDGDGALDAALDVPADPGLVGTRAGFQVLATDGVGLTGTDAVALAVCAPQPVELSQAMIDDAMAIPLPTGGSDFTGGGGPYYGRAAACMLFLALAAHHDPLAQSTSGVSVRTRAVAHVKATATAAGTPPFHGGTAWFDQFVPLAYAVVRRDPAMWALLTPAERAHLDLVMEHVLYMSAIFCQPNSTRTWSIASVQVDMLGRNSGSVPNQSAASHVGLIAAYVYFGGVAAMDAILAAYDVQQFRSRLQAAGLTTIEGYYDDPRIANLFEGVDQTGTLGGSWSVDPLGVRKTIALFNTSSLVDSIPGQEHRYHRYDPLPTTPANIVYRWGHEFYAGCRPRSNVGPGLGGPCGGSDFGLVDHAGNPRATIPYEGDGIGMPAELNTRGAVGGPHNRSSWHYAIWGFTSYAYMYATVALLGYVDPCSGAQNLELYDAVRKTTEIVRFIGEHKWRSSAGPPSEICTWNHSDAYPAFAGTHWAQSLLDSIVFSGAALPTAPVVP